MIRGQKLVLALLVVVLTFNLSRADNVDDFIKAEMERQHVPGVSVVVIKDMKIVKMEGYGFANLELNIPVKPDTVFKIGSVSKQFIAAGIMLLVQDGKISLEDNISKFLEGTPETWKDITVRHLLTHTSGIVREAPGFDPLKIQPDADVIKTAYNSPMRFKPGEKYEYCNVGYFSLAEIIRKVSGKPWPEFLNETIFTPLSMTATRTTTMSDLVPNRANGYVWSNGKYRNASVYLALRPSGAFLSTVSDLAKWEAALNSEKLFKQTTLDQMWTKVKLNDGTTYPYGFGWSVDTAGGHKHIHHGGSLPGFRAQLSRFSDDKLTVVVLTNGDNANAGWFALGIANLYVPGIIRERKVATVDPKIFDAYAGRYQEGTDVLTISTEGDKLMLQVGTNPAKRELVPESQVDFFMRPDTRQTFSFSRDATGQEFLLITIEGREVGRVKKLR